VAALAVDLPAVVFVRLLVRLDIRSAP